MTETDDRCHWDGGQRVTNRHERYCETPGCEGCAPCLRDHCTMPRCANHLRDHERLVCDSCVGKVRVGLARIVQLCGFAPAVAATSTYHSAASVLVGPVAEHSSWAARHSWAVHHRGLCRCDDCPDLRPVPLVLRMCEDADDPKTPCDHWVCRRLTFRPTCPYLIAWLDVADDERHPLWVLGAWDMLVAELLGHHRRNRVTVDTAASYLETNLTDLARMDDFAFDELAREVEECTAHIEGVLLLRAREETGAPCPVCHAQGRKAKPLVREFEDEDLTGDSDYWVCPRAECGQTWTLDEYDRYVERESVLHQERLTASQIALVYRVSEATVRQWAARGHVDRKGFDGQRRQLYDVKQVVAMRDARREAQPADTPA